MVYVLSLRTQTYQKLYPKNDLLHHDLLLGYESDDKNHIIKIIDNGVGMSEKTKNKLFKIDEKITSVGTNNEMGTGLGLILCKELVNTNMGEIWVESELGVGSTFIFNIPKNLEIIISEE